MYSNQWKQASQSTFQDKTIIRISQGTIKKRRLMKDYSRGNVSLIEDIVTSTMEKLRKERRWL